MRRVRPRVLAVAVGGAVWLAASGCVSQGVADQVNERMNYGMTTSEEKIAWLVSTCMMS